MSRRVKANAQKELCRKNVEIKGFIVSCNKSLFNFLIKKHKFYCFFAEIHYNRIEWVCNMSFIG